MPDLSLTPMTGPDGMHFELIEKTEELEILGDDWRRLERESRNINVFQSFDWVFPWWRHFGNGRDLLVVFCRNGSDPLAAAPFYRERRTFLGLPVRRIGVVGEILSTNFEFLFTESGISCLGECFSRAAGAASGWDYVQLKKVPEGSPVRKAMESLGSGNSYRFISIPYARYPYMELEGDFESFINIPSRRSVRRSTRRSLKKLNQEGTVRILGSGDLDLDRVFDELVRLSRRGWKKKAGIDPFAEGGNRDFFREVIRRMNDNARLGLTELEFDGRAVAFELGFDMRGKHFGYYLAYDEEHRNLSPGTIVLSRAVERALAAGLEEFDFSEGQEYFKLQWTDSTRQYEELYLLNTRSNRYPILLPWLLARKKAKGSPRIRRQIEALRSCADHSIFV